MIQQLGGALKKAASFYVGQPATPGKCEQIRNLFVLILMREHGIDWAAQASEISVFFDDMGMPHVEFPNEWFAKTLH